MAYAFKLAPTTALILLTLSACNPPATPTNNATLAAEQNAAAAAAAGNSTGRTDDQQEADMMHDKMRSGERDGMGNMPRSNMPATKGDSMSNSQSMQADKPMDDDMNHM